MKRGTKILLILMLAIGGSPILIGWDGDDDGGKQAPKEDAEGDVVWTVKRRLM